MFVKSTKVVLLLSHIENHCLRRCIYKIFDYISFKIMPLFFLKKTFKKHTVWPLFCRLGALKKGLLINDRTQRVTGCSQGQKDNGISRTTIDKPSEFAMERTDSGTIYIVYSDDYFCVVTGWIVSPSEFRCWSPNPSPSGYDCIWRQR